MSKKNNYHDVAFWEQRYKQNICEWYEWLATPNQIAQIIEKYLKKSAKILQLGCGTSNLAQKLIALHHQSVTCIDFSKEVIKHKQKQAKDGVTYKYHDLTQPLPFEQECYDAIIEKNTLDCLFCYEDFPVKIMRTMKQCYRVLKDGGVMISISHGRKKIRQFFYRNRFSPFSLKVQELKQQKPGQNPIFIYILTKGNSQLVEGDQNQNQEQHQQNNDELLENEDGKRSQEDNKEQQNEKQDIDAEKQPDGQKQNDQNYQFDQMDGA